MNNKQKTKKIEADADYTDITTGEVIKGEELINRLEKIKTNKQKEKEEEIKEKKKCETYLVKNYGSFYFLIWGRFCGIDKNFNSNKTFEDYNPSLMVRFLRLCCCMDYDSGILVYKKGNKKVPMERKQVFKALDVSEKEFNRTIKYLKEENLLTVDNDTYMINTIYTVKGALQLSIKKKIEIGLIRTFEYGFKYVYDHMKTRERPSLFHLIKLLPYVNINYNIICHNPLETEYYKIEPMTPMEIRKMICKDNTQSKKVLESFLDINLEGKGLLAYIRTKGEEKIILNPSLLYGGTREEDVKEIERLMNEESNSK